MAFPQSALVSKGPEPALGADAGAGEDKDAIVRSQADRVRHDSVLPKAGRSWEADVRLQKNNAKIVMYDK
jgi:hypothetical protein